MANQNFEKLLEYIVNGEQEKAEELFHALVVGKSREIYEGLIQEEFDLEEEKDEDEEDEEKVDEASDEEDKEEDIKNNVQESGTPWSNLDLASLESEAFLLGIWKDYQELEMSISMPELASLLESKRKLEYEEKKFLAAILGVDLEKNSQEEDAWTKLKNKVFNGGRKDNDILTFRFFKPSFNLG